MKMRKLIAALEQLRARLNVVVAHLEVGDDEEATVEMEAMERDWRKSMRELRQ